MKTELEVPDTMKRSEIALPGEFQGELAVVVTSGFGDEVVIIDFQHHHPFLSVTAHLTAQQARAIGQVLIEHAERVGR